MSHEVSNPQRSAGLLLPGMSWLREIEAQSCCIAGEWKTGRKAEGQQKQTEV